ncbi:MAG TPA: hypothetical protein PKY63_07910 [Bacteroidales bacterium]|nr:hypothetical protein [Bacteroidales bacterium]
MKKLFQLALIMLFPFWVNSQDCPEYFPLKTGNSWELTNYNKKDKIIGSNSYAVKSVTESATGYEAIVTTSAINEKGEVEGSGDLIMKCESGVFYLDMKNFLDQSAMGNNPDMTVTMTANDLQYPSTMTEGSNLPDASITYQMSSGGMVVMTMTVNITERKVIGKESITTPAGTFEVWKLTARYQSKTGFITTKLSTIEYISIGGGIIKSESFNDKGDLMGYSILTKLSKL